MSFKAGNDTAPRISINAAPSDNGFGAESDEEEAYNATERSLLLNDTNEAGYREVSSNLKTYPPTTPPVSGDLPPTRRPFVADRSSLAHRVRYYDHLSRLDASNNGDLEGLSSVMIPYHILPQTVLLHPFGFSEGGSEEAGETPKYQSSITTIFSIWNTMMGSSLLALPWGFYQSGLVAGFATVFIIGLLSFYSCYLIVKNSAGYDDLMDVARIYLGRFGVAICFISSVLVLVGAIIAFDILMSDSLFENVNSIRYFVSGSEGETDYWSHLTAPIGITVVMFLVGSLKDFSILVRFNTLGVACFLYILGFIIVSAIAFEGIDVDDMPPVFQPKFYYFAGLLMVSYFIHNCILPILKNNNPKNNTRDLGISFSLVALSYGSIGGITYMAYHNSDIPQDFLAYFSHTNIGAIVARFALLLQLGTVYPLILFIVRIQCFGLIFKNQWPSVWHVLALNAFLVGTGTVFAMFYREIGTVLRFVGAICGFLYVFGLPSVVHMMAQRSRKELGIISAVVHSAIVLFGLALLGVQFYE